MKAPLQPPSPSLPVHHFCFSQAVACPPSGLSFEVYLAVPDRPVSPEEEQEQKERLKTSWELVAVLDFLSIFQPYLNLQHLNFSAEELESCLVLNNGSSGLLPELHMVISEPQNYIFMNYRIIFTFQVLHSSLIKMLPC